MYSVDRKVVYAQRFEFILKCSGRPNVAIIKFDDELKLSQEAETNEQLERQQRGHFAKTIINEKYRYCNLPFSLFFQQKKRSVNHTIIIVFVSSAVVR